MARFLRSALMLVVVVVMASNVGQAKVDHQGCKDYPLLTRVPGFYIKGCKELPFATHKFTTTKGKEEVEGHFISISYGLPDGAPPMSGLEMVRNYTNAVRKIGGLVLYEGRYSGSMRVSVEGRSETSHFPHDLGRQRFPRRRTRVRHTRGIRRPPPRLQGRAVSGRGRASRRACCRPRRTGRRKSRRR